MPKMALAQDEISSDDRVSAAHIDINFDEQRAADKEFDFAGFMRAVKQIDRTADGRIATLEV